MSSVHPSLQPPQYQTDDETDFHTMRNPFTRKGRDAPALQSSVYSGQTPTNGTSGQQSKSHTADGHLIPPVQDLRAPVYSRTDGSRSVPALSVHQQSLRAADDRPATATRTGRTYGQVNSNPPRYSVSNTDAALAEYPPLCQRRTPLGLPPSRDLRDVLQDIKEGSVRNIMPCRSFRMVGIRYMPPNADQFVGFFNNTALEFKQALMERSGMALEVDHNGLVKVNDEAIERLDLANRAVRVVARRRRLQGRKFIECVILDARVDSADGRCDVLYEVRWMST